MKVLLFWQDFFILPQNHPNPMNPLSYCPGNLFKKRYILCVIVSLFSLNIFSQPVITSFSPASGSVGTSVTINGSNFSSTPANNIVYFGAVKANVTAASASSLIVTVPVGNTYQPITVTTGGLTGYSARPFIATFTGGGQINSTSFSERIDSTTDLHPNGIAIADFDGDGKPDIATPNNYSISGQPASISILRNTTVAGAISFAPNQDINNGVLTYAIASGDLDGDGKPDLVSCSIADLNISVFRNTSTSGSVSFAPKVNYATTSGVHGIAIGDLDGDGKPDIAVVNYLSTSMSVYRNTSTPGFVSFAPKVDFTILAGAESIVIGDIDGDTKPDIAITNSLFNSFSTFKNISTIGNIAFNTRTDVACGGTNAPNGIALGDMDGDSKTDVAIVITNSSGVCGTQLYRNTSTAGNISLNYILTLTGVSGTTAYHTTLGDINGDGKPDIAMSNTGAGQVKVYQNNSTIGTLAFGSGYSFPGIFGPYAVAIGDMNADSRPDLVASEFTLDKVSVFKNSCGLPGIVSFTPTIAGTGTTVTINGNNFTGVTSVTFGGIAASSFTVVNSTTITAVVGPGATGDVVVTGPLGTGSISGFQFYTAPIITSFTPSSGYPGSVISITGSSFIGITSVSFGGVPASSFFVHGPTLMEATVAGGASGSISVTNPVGTGSLSGFTFTGPVITSVNPNSGGAGSVITITGLNFTTTYFVVIGGLQATSYTVVNATTITATVAQGASNGSVDIYTNYGTASFPGFQYTGPSITSFTPTSGNAGSVITITGSNLTGTTSVSFGGTPASSFTVVNATTITATVGNGSTGNVSLTSPLGNASRSGFQYTGPPIITSFNPIISGPGGPITITGAHFAGATDVSFGGTPAVSFTVVNPTTIVAIIGTGSSGNVSVTTIYGTSTLPGFTFISIPKVTTFSPLSGPIGTTVIISGDNFSALPGNNTVYFGATKATVTASTNSSLTVAVPPGATYEPISVIVNGLTAYSQQPFLVIFNNNGIKSFSATSFAPKVNVDMSEALRNTGISDIDGDGKPDIAVINLGTLGFSVLRNTSTAGNISFATKVNFNVGSQDEGIFIKDFDGDTKPDVIASGVGNVSISRNTSLPGTVSFATKMDILPGLGAFYCYGEDIDLDGKPDVITANYYGESVSVIRNTSIAGSLSFSPRIDINVTGRPERITVKDIDGDSKPDIVISKSNPDAVVVYRNTCTIGNISFAAGISFPAGMVPSAFSVGDLDGDGKVDLVTGNYLSANSTIFRNTSTPGVISFVTSTFTSNVGSASNISLGDINGDGKLDMIFADNAFLNFFNNTSTPGNISFEPKVSYVMSADPVNAAIGDLDGDGRPDIATHFNSNGIYTSILRSKIGDYGITSFSPVSASTGTVITITGINLTGATAVSFGGIAASSFTVVNPTTITAVVGAGASGNVNVTTLGGAATLPGFTYISLPTITSFTPTSGATGTTVTITGTNFTGTTAVAFGGVAAQSFTVNSPTSITAVVGTGASGSVSVTIPGGTATRTGFIFVAAPTITSFTPTSTTNGATVTITGTNFTGTTSVSFGGVAATSFTIVNATTITAVVGIGASGNLSVTTPGGIATKTGFSFIPAPLITSFTPANSTTGAIITITGSNFTGATAVSFGGVAASSFIVVNPTTITAIVSNGATGAISITTPGGTAASSTGFTYDILREGIIIKPNPANDIIIVTHPVSIAGSFLKLIDLNGRTVKLTSIAQNSGSTSMSVKGIPVGLYKLIWTDDVTTHQRSLMITQ
jgi:hypothetical protein